MTQRFQGMKIKNLFTDAQRCLLKATHSITRQEERAYVQSHRLNTIKRYTSCVETHMTNIDYTLDNSPTKLPVLKNVFFPAKMYVAQI